eukprot:gene7444-15225_t
MRLRSICATSRHVDAFASCFCFLIALCSTILCFLPVMMGTYFKFTKLSVNEDIAESIPIRNTLLSSQFQICVFVCLGALCPVLLNLVIDFCFDFKLRKKLVGVAILLMILPCLIKNATTTIWIFPNASFETFQCLLKASLVWNFMTYLFMIKAFCPSVWTWKFIIPIYAMSSACQVISSFEPYLVTNYSIFLIARLMISAFVVIVFVILMIHWMRRIISEGSRFRAFPPDFAFTVLLNNRLIRQNLISNHKRIKINLTMLDYEGHNIEKTSFQGDIHKLGQVIKILIANAADVTPSNDSIEIITELYPKSQLKYKTSTSTSTSKYSHKSYSQPRMRRNSSMMNSPIESDYYLSITICDHGPGIAKDDMATIFDNSIQFKAGVLESIDERSVGLWVAYRIVELHKGTLSVESTEGYGSKFTIEIPCSYNLNDIDNNDIDTSKNTTNIDPQLEFPCTLPTHIRTYSTSSLTIDSLYNLRNIKNSQSHVAVACTTSTQNDNLISNSLHSNPPRENARSLYIQSTASSVDNDIYNNNDIYYNNDNNTMEKIERESSSIILFPLNQEQQRHQRADSKYHWICEIKEQTWQKREKP